jgi:hypothetical protein
MRHGLAKQLLLAELDADPLLQIAQPLEFGLAERRRGELWRGSRWRGWERLGGRRRWRRDGSD